MILVGMSRGAHDPALAKESGIQLFVSAMPVYCTGKSLPSQGTFVTALVLTCKSESCGGAPGGGAVVKK